MKIALVGAGAIGKEWVKALSEKNVRITYVVDTDKERGDSLAKDAGAEYLSSVKEALKKGTEAALVAVPHAHLASIAKQFLAEGVHVLSEKPGGISSKEIAANTKLAAKKKVVYMIGFNHRYHPGYAEAKKRFDAGEIGDLMFIRARYGFGGRAGYEKEWRLHKKIAGGGELLDQGIHMIDIARWFMGDIQKVKGFAENMFWGGDVEDNGFALLRNKKGNVAQIHVSWTNWEWVHQFEIFGTKGYLIVDGLDSRYRGPERLTIGITDPRAGTFPKEELITFPDEKKESSLGREMEAFLLAIKKKVKVPSGADASAALKIVETIYDQK